MRMKRILILLCLLGIFSWDVSAQVRPQFTHFHNIGLSYNPAVAGSVSGIDIVGLYRGQWVGIDGSPSTQLISVHAPISSIRSGVGLTIMNDMLGAQRSTSFMLHYAYRIQGRWGKLGFGLSFGMYQKALRGNDLRSPTGTYTSGINHNDNLIPDQLVSGVAPELSLGVYYNNDNLYAGIAVNDLLESKFSVDAPTQTTEISFIRSYNITAGYLIEINSKLTLQPNIQFITDLDNHQTNISAILGVKDNIATGVAFRGNSKNTIDALSLLFGFRIYKQLRIGYSYDISLSSLNKVNSGSHELYIRYLIPLTDRSKPGKVIYNPRFL